MTSRILIGLFATLIALTSVGCTYNSHPDHHDRGGYRVERGGHYGGYDNHSHHDRRD